MAASPPYEVAVQHAVDEIMAVDHVAVELRPYVEEIVRAGGPQAMAPMEALAPVPPSPREPALDEAGVVDAVLYWLERSSARDLCIRSQWFRGYFLPGATEEAVERTPAAEFAIRTAENFQALVAAVPTWAPDSFLCTNVWTGERSAPRRNLVDLFFRWLNGAELTPAELVDVRFAPDPRFRSGPPRGYAAATYYYCLTSLADRFVCPGLAAHLVATILSLPRSEELPSREYDPIVEPETALEIYALNEPLAGSVARWRWPIEMYLRGAIGHGGITRLDAESLASYRAGDVPLWLVRTFVPELVRAARNAYAGIVPPGPEGSTWRHEFLRVWGEMAAIVRRRSACPGLTRYLGSSSPAPVQWSTYEGTATVLYRAAAAIVTSADRYEIRTHVPVLIDLPQSTTFIVPPAWSVDQWNRFRTAVVLMGLTDPASRTVLRREVTFSNVVQYWYAMTDERTEGVDGIVVMSQEEPNYAEIVFVELRHFERNVPYLDLPVEGFRFRTDQALPEADQWAALVQSAVESATGAHVGLVLHCPAEGADSPYASESATGRYYSDRLHLSVRASNRPALKRPRPRQQQHGPKQAAPGPASPYPLPPEVEQLFLAYGAPQ